MTRKSELKTAVAKRNAADLRMKALEKYLRRAIVAEARRRKDVEKKLDGVRHQWGKYAQDYNAAQNLINAIR